MAVPFSFIILSSVVFLALQHAATGLRCYSCDPCDAVNNSMPTTSSNGTEYSCWKTIRVIATGVAHTSCSSDLCNSGIPVSSSIGLSLFLIMAGSIIQCVFMH
ncbi:unnamed protein product [Rotaria socialis]|uniref:Uncharacterized protein n=1 Tax=Rotaria socialis TaxID=392032 RepID=A0A821BE92_9BILA|nr:unnamed protein product [Rotaria socialis]